MSQGDEHALPRQQHLVSGTLLSKHTGQPPSWCPAYTILRSESALQCKKLYFHTFIPSTTYNPCTSTGAEEDELQAAVPMADTAFEGKWPNTECTTALETVWTGFCIQQQRRSTASPQSPILLIYAVTVMPAPFALLSSLHILSISQESFSDRQETIWGSDFTCSLNLSQQ